MTRAVVLGIALLAGCGGADGSDPCEASPTFAEDIAPISEEKCVPCHSPEGVRRGAPPELNFHDWPSVEPNVGEFADAITSGRQPPMTFMPAVTADERAVVSRWRACGFKE